MNGQSLELLRPALLASAALAAFASAMPANAQEARGGVEIRVGAEAASNPYLERGEDAVTAAINGEVRPWIRLEDARTTYSLNASVQGRSFADRYEFEDNYSGNLGIVHRASERLTLNAQAGIFSSATRLSSLIDRLGEGGLDAPLPDLPVELPIDDDVTVIGQRGRTTTLSFGAGASAVLDARNRLAFDANYRDYWFERPGAEDYRSYGGEGRYTHVLDEGTSVGAVFSYQLTNYQGTTQGDAQTSTAMASLAYRMGQYWSLDASGGASLTEIDATPFQPQTDFTSVSARVSLCGRDGIRSMCFNYSRLPQPTALGGVRNSDSFGLSFDERVSERDRLSLGVSYNRSGQESGSLVPVPTVQYGSMRANFQRRISQRVSAFVSGTVARISRADYSVEPSITVGGGISVNLGQLR